MWDLWSTKWHWDRFFSESFGFILSESVKRYSVFTHISFEGWTKGPLEAQFHRDIVSPHQNNNKYSFFGVRIVTVCQGLPELI
jgi:hypothetical protein